MTAAAVGSGRCRRRPSAQAPIEGELNLITPVSKFIHDAALKAFADYAKEKWNVTVKVSAIPAGTPVAYGRIVGVEGPAGGRHLLGRGVRALREARRAEAPAEGRDLRRPAWDSIPASIGKPKPIPLKDKDGYWVGTALEPYGLVYNPKRIQRLGVARAEGLGRPAQSQAQGRGRPVRADALVVVERDLRGDPLAATARSKGWDWLRKLAANTGHFTARSRDVPTVVAKGEFAAGFAVPSYMAFEEKLAGFDIKFVAPKNAFVTPGAHGHPRGRAQSEGGARVHRVPPDRARAEGVHGARALPDHARSTRCRARRARPRSWRWSSPAACARTSTREVANVYDEAAAAKRSEALKTRFRTRHRGKWDELKKK